VSDGSYRKTVNTLISSGSKRFNTSRDQLLTWHHAPAILATLSRYTLSVT